MIRWIVTGAALATTLLLGGCSMEAMQLLRDIAAGPEASRLKDETPPPIRQRFHYTHEQTTETADIYIPGDRPGPDTPDDPPEPRATLILAPGAAPGGKDDPRLVAFAKSFARVGFMVVVPDIREIQSLELSADDVKSFRAIIRAVTDRCTNGAPGSVGVLALSYAAGPALLASLAPADERRVGFMVAIGPYYDMTNAITYFTTGAFRKGGPRKGGQWQFREPNSYSKWAFARANADWLDDAGDRTRIRAMADRRLDDPGADIRDLVEGLDHQGRAIHRLLTNTDPDRVPDLIDDLPESLRHEIAALDLKGVDLSGRAPPMILIHGRDDAMIPFTESRALRDALKRAGVPAKLHMLHTLNHVDLESGGWWHRIRDAVEMGRALDRVLDHRDRIPAPTPCYE